MTGTARRAEVAIEHHAWVIANVTVGARAGRARSIASLGNSRSSMHSERHVEPSTTEHAHERIDTKEVDLATHEVANPRLRNSQELGRLGLRKIPALEDPMEFDHQISAKPEILGLLGAESEITEDIA